MTQLNLTAQTDDLTPDDKELLLQLLSVDEIPDHDEILDRAEMIAELTLNYPHNEALISGPDWLMYELERTLHQVRIKTTRV